MNKRFKFGAVNLRCISNSYFVMYVQNSIGILKSFDQLLYAVFRRVKVRQINCCWFLYYASSTKFRPVVPIWKLYSGELIFKILRNSSKKQLFLFGKRLITLVTSKQLFAFDRHICICNSLFIIAEKKEFDIAITETIMTTQQEIFEKLRS